MSILEFISKKIRALVSHEVNSCFCDYDIRIRRLLSSQNESLLFGIESSKLTESTLNSTNYGITTDKICQNEVVVSLTSYGKRLNDVYIPIESIMQGSVKPNRIILWLAEEELGKQLPVTLQKQQKRGLDIRYCKDIKSYKKLIPTLKEFPEACIVTIDDDVIYQFDLLENLLLSYNNYPNYIHANRVHTISLDNHGLPLPYNEWQCCSTIGNNSILNFATGVGGILYPPNSLDKRVFDETTFMSICPTADDIWFFAMAHLNGFNTCKSFTRDSTGNDFLENPSVQDVALKQINKIVNCKNDIQLTAVIKKYNLTLNEKI